MKQTPEDRIREVGVLETWSSPLFLMPLLFFFMLFSASMLAASAQNPSERLRYDQVAWLCTHNAFSAEKAGYKLPNQTHTLTEQLDQGVRALMLDFWKQDNAIVLRHGKEIARYLGFEPILPVLANLARWMNEHPRAVVTLIIESHVPADELARSFEQAGLAKLAHTQNPQQAWPTLAELIRTNKRLIVLTDRPKKGPAWMMPVWDHCWETHYAARKPEDLKPDINRGKKKNALFIMNHFLSNPFPAKKWAQPVN